MYGCTALPWIGPGRTSATCTVRSSRFSGRVSAAGSASARGSRSGRRRRCRPPGSRRRPPGRRAGCARGRSARRAGARSGRRTPRPRESIPSPSRSILRKPASEQLSLSHWQICRPAIAAGCTGHEVDQRPRRDDHPAGVLGDVARQAGDLAGQLAERVPARPGVRRPARRRAPRRRASRPSRR